jgi:oxygen-independent coproporphyrinogen-3 oxidase
MKSNLGIYLHIPFCVKKCGYCDFCSFPDKSGEYMSAYVRELCRRIEAESATAKGYEVDTVYFGGGTPSLLEVAELEKIIDSLKRSFDIAPSAEITLECNPATADRQYFEDIRKLGVNRLSIGLQSAVDAELALLGRAHGCKDFVKCFSDARAAGFDNVSADLMYGIPDQTLDSFEYSLDFLISLSPEHISAYGLTLEEGTRFWRQRETLCLADDDAQAQMYCLCSKKLADAGYEKYEISNFSKKGRRSRHNLRYWQGREYLGFGVAAYSYFGSRRYGNSRDIGAFISGEDILAEDEALTDNDIREEDVMLGLRLAEGIDTSEYSARFGRNFFEDYAAVEKWIEQGFMGRHGSRIYFTDKGFLVSNSILSDMLRFD